MDQRQHRVRVLTLGGYVGLLGIGREGKPGLNHGETEARIGAAAPLHRGACWIAILAYPRSNHPKRIACLLRWDGHVVHANFIPGVQRWCAAQGEQQQQSNTRLRRAKTGHKT